MINMPYFSPKRIKKGSIQIVKLYQTFNMEQVTGFEPVSSRWQRDIIALILYLQVLTLYYNPFKIASRILKLFRIDNLKIAFIIY